MHYGELKKCDIANGIGVRVTLFVSGCTNHCPDCFQPQTWDFDYGRAFTDETKAEIFAELDKPFVNGLTVLGGEPFEPRNQRELLPLLREVREKYPDKTIWCFTGFRLEDELLRSGRLLFSVACRDTIREFAQYRWEENAPEDRPRKENDHAMDEIRYFVSTVLSPAPRNQPAFHAAALPRQPTGT